MSDEKEPLDPLIASVANGDPVDWDAAAGRATSDAERARVATLRGIAGIAAFSRSLQGEPGDATEPLPFERWGDLVLLERLGAGAHAEVFRAWDPTLQRDVALKLLRAPVASGAEPSPLLDEGRALARIRHPHVVAVYGVGRHEGRVGLWMELARGPSLERWVERHGALDPDDAIALASTLAAAAAAVHEAGMLHRDLKPANVVRDAAGRWMLADFGLGLREGGGAPGRLSGTPVYMAPECLAGAPASERSEVYALGQLVRFALTGHHPFAETRLEALHASAARGLPPLRSVRPDAPAALAAAIDRAIAPDPHARVPSAAALLAALERAGGGTPMAARRSWMLAAAAVLAIVTAIAAPRMVARAPAPPPASPPTVAASYDVEAALERHTDAGVVRLLGGDRVGPGDRLSLAFRSTQPTWVYVLNEDDAGERYLLFPQPLFDARNPIAPDSTVRLPGTVGGRPNAWTVTSRGGRERFLVVASPAPVAALEEELARLPAPRPDRPIRYAPVREEAVERLRGTGGLAALPETPRPAPAPAFERFKALADREAGVRGVWVRQIVLENP